MLASHYPLVVPMEMRISQVKLRGIVVLVVDQEKGITLVFKNDPLESVLVNSVLYSSNSDIR
jgi:mitochondrial distribution and morphology protein 34